MARKIKILIIHDSDTVRENLASSLSQEPGMEIIGSAPDVNVSRETIIRLEPDVIALAVEIPGMDTIDFLRRLLPQHPIPTVVISSLTQKGKFFTMQALEAGAVDFVPMPSSGMAHGLPDMLAELKTKIIVASSANISLWKGPFYDSRHTDVAHHVQYHREVTDKIIVIGASTGGPEAIRRIISLLPADMPGILITQHMPRGFTKTFAARLNQVSELQVKEAESGDRILNGRVLIAPGDLHMKIVRSGGLYQVSCFHGEKMNGQRPSIDVLFISVAEHTGLKAIGILLSGFGNDGVRGLKAIKDNGAVTFAQDKKTSVVYDLPKTACELGAVDFQFNPEEIAEQLIEMLNKTN